MQHSETYANPTDFYVVFMLILDLFGVWLVEDGVLHEQLGAKFGLKQLVTR